MIKFTEREEHLFGELWFAKQADDGFVIGEPDDTAREALAHHGFRERDIVSIELSDETPAAVGVLYCRYLVAVPMLDHTVRAIEVRTD